MSQTVTKNDDFVPHILSGALEVRPRIVAFNEKGVVFSDGTQTSADTVIFAHGYQPAFPFLTLPEGVGRRHPGLLYLRMFIPELGDRLAFCGFARPSIGAIPPTGELQARYIAQLAAGVASLPDTETMRADILRMVQTSSRTFPALLQPHVVVSWMPYLDQIAERVGCRPDPLKLLAQPRLLWKVMTGPMTLAMYRLHGPGADPVARQTVLKLPRMHQLSELLTLLGLHFWIWPISLFHADSNWQTHNEFI